MMDPLITVIDRGNMTAMISEFENLQKVLWTPLTLRLLPGSPQKSQENSSQQYALSNRKLATQMP